MITVLEEAFLFSLPEKVEKITFFNNFEYSN